MRFVSRHGLWSRRTHTTSRFIVAPPQCVLRSNCLAVCYVVKPFRRTTFDAESTSDGQLNDNEWLLYRLVPSHVVLLFLGTLVVFGLVRPTRWLRSKTGNDKEGDLWIMGYRSQVRRSAQPERKRHARLSSENVLQETGSTYHMKKATSMGDEVDVGLPYRCSACKEIQMTLARWVLSNFRIVASLTFDPFVDNLSFVQLLVGSDAFKEASPEKGVESSFDRYDNEEVALRSSIQGSRSRREVALAMLN
nr:ribosomal protein S19, mitochondrial-like [Tanacetum cinerariifolium]